MRITWILPLATLACASSSSLVAHPWHPGDPGDNHWSGVVRYRDDGPGPDREKRRQDAMNRMSKECHGQYDIQVEGDRYDGHTVSVSDSHFRYDQTDSYAPRDWYIQFTCR